MSRSEIKIETYLFINIGVTGLYDRNHDLSEVKLIAKPVSRQQLLTSTVDIQEGYHLFDFLPVNHVSGFSLEKYNLAFSIEEYERLIAFIQALPRPVSLVAYNGFPFHYPILKGAIQGLSGLPDYLLCTDLMQAVFELENGFGPQTPRSSGLLPWEFKRDHPYKPYRFSQMFLWTIGRDCGVDESIQNRKKSDNDEGLPMPKLRAIVEWATLYTQVRGWLDLRSSYEHFNSWVRDAGEDVDNNENNEEVAEAAAPEDQA